MACRVVALTAAGVALLPVAEAAAARPGPVLNVLSNRTDLISGGDALVAIDLPRGLRPSAVRVRVEWPVRRRVRGRMRTIVRRRNLTRAFAMRPNGSLQGLVTDLPVGRSVLRVTARGRRSSRAVVVNRPNSGPVLAGPQLQPWKCQATAVDENCNQPVRFTWFYMSTDSNKRGLQPYDPARPASDVAMTTTDQGVRVPFIVRLETGYQDRDQYKIATLFRPGEPWEPWAPQEQWNRKLVITHGSGCGVHYGAGEAPAVFGPFSAGIPGVDTAVAILGGDVGATALGRGFAVMSTALNHNSHNCNIALQAESMIMAKEHLVETYGPLRYTIASGCSGGAVTQQQVANAYPGLYQGLTPQCAYPDTLSPGAQFADYHLLRLYFEDSDRWGPGVFWLPTQWASVEGHVAHLNAIAADEGLFKSAVDPTHPCRHLPAERRYHPQNNPAGARCSILDAMINVLGPRPPEVWTPIERSLGRGFAGMPFGSQGIQYGLESLRRGEITAAQFVDLNARIGGLDIDARPSPDRMPGDDGSLVNAYRSGALNQANNLDLVAIINSSGPDHGIAHDFAHAVWMQERIVRAHGHRRNYVMWFGHFPVLGDLAWASESVVAMDRWLAAVERDTSDRPLPEKIVENRPSDIQDRCSQIQGLQVVAVPGVGPVCQLDYVQTRFGTPRTVAGGDYTSDANKCHLKPLRREDYRVQFTEAQWAQLQQTFPDGVCDWSRPGVGQQPTVAWQTYQERDGRVIYGGRQLGPLPPRSAQGWASEVFRAQLARR